MKVYRLGSMHPDCNKHVEIEGSKNLREILLKI